MGGSDFEWDDEKDLANRRKHGVSFEEAQDAFGDPDRVIVRDLAHERGEKRFFCLGRTERGIMTVRFSYRKKRIRVYGAGFWREGRKRYEQENEIHE